MKRKYLVSIVINNFNYGEFIQSCIESALAQTYDNCEIIVVDDGSTDKSPDVIGKFGDRIIFLRKPNGGQASALNAGYALSSGDIVLFIDSDDRMKTNCAEIILEKWEEKFSKIHFNLEIIDNNGQAAQKMFRMGPLASGNLRNDLLSFGFVPSVPMSGNAFSRSFLDRVMPMPEIGWEQSADVYLFNVAALWGEIGAIDRALGEYRVHGRNQSAIVQNNRVNISRLSHQIGREILTDQAIFEQSKSLGLIYKYGRLVKSAAHIQQKLIYEKAVRSCIPAGLLASFLGAIIKDKVPLFKKMVVIGATIVISIVPSRLAEWLVVRGYRRGIILAGGHRALM